MPDNTPATDDTPENVTAAAPSAGYPNVTNLTAVSAPNPDVPPVSIVVPIAFEPGVVSALRKAGFLVGPATPDAITAAVFGMLADAWRAGVYRDPAEPVEPAPANDDVPAELVG